MFVGNVTIAEDAKVAYSAGDVTIFSARVYFRVSDSFQDGIDEKGEAKYTYSQFVDASFKVWKNDKRNITADNLKKDTIVFIEGGSLGQDKIPKKSGGPKEHAWFMRLKASRFYVVGKKPERAAATPALPAGASQTTTPPKEGGASYGPDFF